MEKFHAIFGDTIKFSIVPHSHALDGLRSPNPSPPSIHGRSMMNGRKTENVAELHCFDDRSSTCMESCSIPSDFRCANKNGSPDLSLSSFVLLPNPTKTTHSGVLSSSQRTKKQSGISESSFNAVLC